jgi:hypothetical protein
MIHYSNETLNYSSKDHLKQNLQEHGWERTQLGISTADCALQQCGSHPSARYGPQDTHREESGFFINTMTEALHSCEADRKPGLRFKFLLLLLSLLLQGDCMLLRGSI